MEDMLYLIIHVVDIIAFIVQDTLNKSATLESLIGVVLSTRDRYEIIWYDFPTRWKLYVSKGLICME
jgi:hypothetical protein